MCGNDIRKLKLAVVFQMTFVGMPCVFYGDEFGVTGVREYEYRQPMPWGRIDHPLYDFYSQAVHLRNSEPALRRGTFIRKGSDSALYVYSREYGDDRITVALNASSSALPYLTSAQKILLQSEAENGMIGPYGFMITKG